MDAAGNAVVDPTENVKSLTEAAVARIDDMAVLRTVIADREAGWQNRIGELRAEHQKDLDALEAKRLDAIRERDQLAVKTEADRSAAAITALATTAATTAETLRNAVNTSATNLATQLTNTVNAITERIASLEKLSYTGQGRQAIADPQLADMIAEMRKLSADRTHGDGKSEGFSTSWAIVLAVITILMGLYAFTRSAPPAPSGYAPAPAGYMLPNPPAQPVAR